MMDDAKRRELGERLSAACGWDDRKRIAIGVVWTSADGRIVPNVRDGGTMRAALEWAREVTGRQWLSVCAGVLGAGWVVVDDCGVVEGCDQLHATEAEAHVALAEWAAENRK